MVELSSSFEVDTGLDLLDLQTVFSSSVFEKLRSSFLSSRLFPALIFESNYLPEADTFAWAIAKMIYCNSHTGCGKCSGCKLFDMSSLSDFLLIKKPSSSIKIEDTRQLVDHFSTSCSKDSYRVVFISEVESMGGSAMNSLLKVLEELPDRSFCLMSTSWKDHLLPTILSRCVSINVRSSCEFDSSKLYPMITQDLIKAVSLRIKHLLGAGVSSDKNSLDILDLWNHCEDLGSMDMYRLIHMGLSKFLRDSSKSNQAFDIDTARLDLLIQELSEVGLGVRVGSSLNPRLIFDRCLV